MNFDATKKIKHCYTRTIAQKKKWLLHKNQPFKKKKIVVTQEPTIQKNVAIKCIILCQKGKYQEAKFRMNLYESKLIKDQLMDK